MEKDSRGKRDKTSARKVVRIRPGRKSIVLGVTGSIAAYKSAELASLLVKQGHEVFVVMTKDATEFIPPLTLQTLSKNPVTTSFYDEKENWRPGHIDLADRAELRLIAPAAATAIAESALAAGHDVTLISGPVNLHPPRGAQFVQILTSDEMFEAVHRHVHECDVLVMCAAVADYKPQTISPTKIKKNNEHLALDLVPTRDILTSLPPKNRQFLVVGFAADTNDIEENAAKPTTRNCRFFGGRDVRISRVGTRSSARCSLSFLIFVGETVCGL